MRFVFVYWKLENAGSLQTLVQYVAAAKRRGHEVALYEDEDPSYPIPCTRDLDSADAVVFLMEWNIYLHKNLPLDLEGPLAGSARHKRIVIDNDGMYNDVIKVNGDYNHPAVEDSQKRMALYESISDKIVLPSYHPRLKNVGTFIFHGYDQRLERPLEFGKKPFGMVYIGSNWFRWRAMKRVLEAVEPIRSDVGRIALIGHDWAEAPYWIEQPLRDDAYFTDPEYLRHLEVEIFPAIPVEEVVSRMSEGHFNPVLARPTFNALRLVNPRLFETLAANTIPVFNLDQDYVAEIYGEASRELVLTEKGSDLIADVISRPSYYQDVVEEMRAHLRQHHSYDQRIQELVALAAA